jgi:hypothetical protein
MNQFRQLHSDVVELTFSVSGNTVIGEIPKHLTRAVEDVRQLQRMTIEQYLLNYCGSAGNLLSLERSGSGIVRVDGESDTLDVTNVIDVTRSTD